MWAIGVERLDGVTGDAADASVRGRVVLVEIGVVEQTAKERYRVMTASAEARGVNIARVLRTEKA